MSGCKVIAKILASFCEGNLEEERAKIGEKTKESRRKSREERGEEDSRE